MAELNASASHYGASAVVLLLFSLWDWYVDPVGWRTALIFRVVGAAIIVATGPFQRWSGRVSWAPAITKVRFGTAVLAVAAANASLQQGYIVGLAGLVAILLGGPYIALDRRDYLTTTLIPLAGIAAIMFAVKLDRFAVINAWSFLALALVVGLMLARVFEASNRRAFALEQQLMRETRTDALTGLANRRSVEETVGLELKRHRRSGKPLALILCDLDHFKRINDERGHEAGDRSIRAIGEALRSVMRATDTLGRWGGEEFLAILPETSAEEAGTLAERMRSTVETSPMPGAPGFHVTVSLGVAATNEQSDDWAPDIFEIVLRAADDAMYRAKAEGRNRVVIAVAAAVLRKASEPQPQLH